VVWLAVVAWQRRGRPLRCRGYRTMARILPVQCFLARTALEWTMPDLARAAGVSKKTVQRFERGDTLKASTVKAIQRAFENAGVIFIDAEDGGPGARLRKAE
jgi:DNA-binding XRE family transcriptional regulator